MKTDIKNYVIIDNNCNNIISVWDSRTEAENQLNELNIEEDDDYYIVEMRVITYREAYEDWINWLDNDDMGKNESYEDFDIVTSIGLPGNDERVEEFDFCFVWVSGNNFCDGVVVSKNKLEVL